MKIFIWNARQLPKTIKFFHCMPVCPCLVHVSSIWVWPHAHQDVQLWYHFKTLRFRRWPQFSGSASNLQAFTDTLIFPFFEYFLSFSYDWSWYRIKSSRPAVDRMKQLTSDLRRVSRMTSFQDFPILALQLGYSSLVAPISLFFSNWGKLDVPSTFHVNFCSLPIFHQLESTDIPTPQQLSARGRHVYSFFCSAATRVARLWQVSFGDVITYTFVGLKCLTETKIPILCDHVGHTRFHIDEMGCQMVQLLSAHISWTNNVREFDPSLKGIFPKDFKSTWCSDYRYWNKRDAV